MPYAISPGYQARIYFFGVTQKLMYLPKRSRVWASRLGSTPNTFTVIGIKIHSKTKNKCFHLGKFGGVGGKSNVETIADVKSPTMASVMSVEVICGRLYERIVLENCPWPTITGSHPRSIRIMADVDQDQNPSICTNV